MATISSPGSSPAASAGEPGSTAPMTGLSCRLASTWKPIMYSTVSTLTVSTTFMIGPAR